MIFNSDDFVRLRSLFDGSYRGYRPEVVEAPNGDGALDVQKRYLHVATKYDPPDWAAQYLHRAFAHAETIASELKIPPAFWPDLDACALRVLEYPVGANSAEHTDFDLFTFNAYRNTQDVVGGDGRLYAGELGEIIGLGPATSHHVPARPYEQHSIVFFALPRHSAVLPGGLDTVDDWLQERISRSRYAKGAA